MPSTRYPHLFLPGPTDSREFSSPPSGGSKKLRTQDRIAHAKRIIANLQEALTEDEHHRLAALTTRSGLYLAFRSEPDCDLMLKSLESYPHGIRLMNVQKRIHEGTVHTEATVFVPKEASGYFLKKVREYATVDLQRKSPRTGEIKVTAKNAKLVESIADVRLAILESFWMDHADALPGESPDWVEAWLSSEDLGVIERFCEVCASLGIEVGDGRIGFPERTVLLICASRHQLVDLLEHSDSLAEFRAAREVASFFIKESNRDQAAWVDDLLERLRFKETESVSVLVLDHGVNNGHRLLAPLLQDTDRHTVKPEWGTHDQHGHGTLMAGTAAFGDLLILLQTQGPVQQTHCLESAKILPPPGQPGTAKRLWGFYTAQGISRAEVQAPDRKRIICMAVTSEETRDRGRPSSWSGMIDELAFGYGDERQRLIIVSGGNVRDPEDWKNYPESNKSSEVHDPAQAWNALTVGACTNKTRIVDAALAGYTVLADAGNLSPFSSTSLTWAARKWPIKPEVLFEGGNAAISPDGKPVDHDDLQMLSTCAKTHQAQFEPFNATSAAAAQAAWMAAKIQAAYPSAWPETIRALIVHTAEWTEAQIASHLADERKVSYARLARGCGYGVPNLERALYCAANSLTLISQAVIQPFDKHPKQSRYISRDMHLYRLPWPVEALASLGETPVRLRVTLSYFVEPSPGEVGWQDRYRYASHALRFELNGPGESEDEFVQRINAKARDEDERSDTEGPGDRWTLGGFRNVGSIHSDIWKGTAAELAASNKLAVHPAIGWWRERHHLGRWNRQSRYSLLVSIHLPGTELDIYTPVAAQIGIPIPISV